MLFFFENLSMFSSIFTRDSCPSFKLVSNAGRVFISIANISENFDDFSVGLAKFPEDLRLTLLGEYRLKW